VREKGADGWRKTQSIGHISDKQARRMMTEWLHTLDRQTAG
jgi:hypothetical protein